MTDRIPLYQQMHTAEGGSQEAWVALYEHVGVTVSDEVRNARGAGPRDTRPTPHEYGECSRGPSQCPVHRREYRAQALLRLALLELREQEQKHRVAAMNVFRIESMLGAPMGKS